MNNELTYNVEIKSEEIFSYDKKTFIGYKTSLFINNKAIDATWSEQSYQIKGAHKRMSKVAKREVKRLRALATTTTFSL